MTTDLLCFSAQYKLEITHKYLERVHLNGGWLRLIFHWKNRKYVRLLDKRLFKVFVSNKTKSIAFVTKKLLLNLSKTILPTDLQCTLLSGRATKLEPLRYRHKDYKVFFWRPWTSKSKEFWKSYCRAFTKKKKSYSCKTRWIQLVNKRTITNKKESKWNHL